LLGVSVPYGRTPEPDEETDAAIWLQWQQCRVENLESPDALAAMMQVTETLLPKVEGLSLTTSGSVSHFANRKRQTGGHHMPDEIDRDQEFNEQRLEEMIEQSRFKPGQRHHYSTVVYAVNPFLKSDGRHCRA
jgi:hypothetical protein